MIMEIAIDFADIIAIIISFAYVIVIILAMKLLSGKLDRETRRKFTHTSMGIWPLLWFLYDNAFAAFLVPLIVTILITLAPQNIRELFSKGEEKHIGLVIYCFSFTVITFFLYMNWIGAAAIFTLAFADGVSGWVGRKHGKHFYQVPWSKPKSIEGSLGMFIASAISIYVAQLIFSTGVDFLLILVGSIVATVVEGISPKHSDNLFVPLILAAVLYYFP